MERMMTAVLSLSPFNSLVAIIPLISGIVTSSTTTSGRSSPQSLTAWLPFSASPMTRISLSSSSTAFSPCLNILWSSAITTLIAMSTALHRDAHGHSRPLSRSRFHGEHTIEHPRTLPHGQEAEVFTRPALLESPLHVESSTVITDGYRDTCFAPGCRDCYAARLRMFLNVGKRFVGYPEQRRLDLAGCPHVPGELFEVALQGAVQTEVEKSHGYKLQGYVPDLVNRVHQHIAYGRYRLARFIARDVNSLSIQHVKRHLDRVE